MTATPETQDANEVAQPSERLFGIRCADDGGIIPCTSSEQRDRLYEHMRKQNGTAGCRIPETMLRRPVPGGEWSEERRA